MSMKDVKFNEKHLFSIHDPRFLKLLLQLRLNFRHLNKHKFIHNFNYCPIFVCRLEMEFTQNFFLCHHFYHNERPQLLNTFYKIDLAIK